MRHTDSRKVLAWIHTLIGTQIIIITITNACEIVEGESDFKAFPKIIALKYIQGLQLCA